VRECAAAAMETPLPNFLEIHSNEVNPFVFA
jgi:hypothetical protein